MDSTPAVSNANFVVGLLQQLHQDGSNVVLSPYSLISALMMLMIGTEPGSRRQMLETLQSSSGKAGNASEEDFAAQTERFITQFTTTNGDILKQNAATLKIANLLYPAQNYELKAEYVAKLANELNATAKQLDFAHANAHALKTINTDVSEATAGLIPDFLRQISSATRLVLVNAIYFRGLWQTPFEERRTDANGKFYLSNGQEVKAAMMSAKQSPYYYQDAMCQAIQLHYQFMNGNTALVVILPAKNVTLSSFVKSLTAEQLSTIMQGLVPQGKVIIKLPRFRLNSEHFLAKNLEALGLKTMFGSQANLTNISPNGDLFVSEVVQKAIIEVDETGTKAAAATGMMLLGSSASFSPPLEFTADRPFMFSLVTTDQPRQILFMGTVENPNDNSG